jgi:dihydrofolate reductase
MITLIAARAKNGAIGKDNTIPWRAPEDLAFFQRETLGGALVMGRNTWDSLPFKPLKGRLNLVVTSQADLAEHTFTSLEAALSEAQSQGYCRVYGMGGARVYRDLLPVAHRLLITEVELDLPDADTFFPEFKESEWQCVGSRELRGADPRCVLYEYLRR